MKKQYQPPVARFESLRLRENVANSCWGYDVNGYSGTLYADRNRIDGYTKFHISSFAGTCKVGEKSGRTFTIDKVVGDDSFTAGELAARGPLFVGVSRCSPS